ncbi:hypothetical protein KUV64_22150 [Mameliella alba]|uniref:hypothetical protein n=1 Tax=Mameliella alba TaxID=561184 RepID=UPI001C9571E4|nr:hypothetical protein [Mameliella alba]MBY6121841.1 hypothetical protein [Mameliella alba]
MSNATDMKKFFYQSPGLKTATSILLTVSGGFFTSTLSTEITTAAGISWSVAPSTASFWLLLAVCVLTYFFHKFMHAHEHGIQAFQDTEYCIAYARSQLIPTQIQAYQKQIESGDLDQFEDAMSKIKESLK